MGRPTAKEKERYTQFIIPRRDKRYTRIEKLTDEEFLNAITFEFFLRDKEFKIHFDELYKMIEISILDEKVIFYPMSTAYNELEKKYSDIFSMYNYRIYEISRYIFCDIHDKNNLNIGQHYDACKPSGITGNLFEQSQMIFSTVQNTPSFDTQENWNRFIAYFKVAKFKYEYPTYYDADNINVSINLNLNKKVLLKQMGVILEELQKNQQIDENYKARKLVGKNNIKKTFAHYFYIYDHRQHLVPMSIIQKEINSYIGKPNIRVNTIRKHILTMKDLTTSKNFLKISI